MASLEVRLGQNSKRLEHCTMTTRRAISDAKLISFYVICLTWHYILNRDAFCNGIFTN